MTQSLQGCAGKQLRVHLGRREASVQQVSDDLFWDYLGGVGYAARLLYDELDAGIDPLGPSNKMVVATGPLSLNGIPGGGSVMLCFKSPLTGGWAESRCGSDFGPDLKRAGFDHIIIEGQADEPVYLVVDNSEIDFRPAGHLLGKTVTERTEIVGEELGGQRYSFLCIGPAGENLVRFATAMVGDRAAGRCGAGAVLGAKNLLGIAVRGDHVVEAAEPARFQEVLRRTFREIRENPMSSGFREFGTVGDLGGNDEAGDWPTKNWQANSWGRGNELYDRFEKNNLIGSFGCYRGCALACGRRVHVENGAYRTPEHGGAEYESISCFTAYVLNDDMDAAVHSTHLCNEYGLDTISAGSMIAFAMECAEHGLLSHADTGDMDLSWGNAEVLPVLVKQMATREGLGDLLADGVRIAADRIGPDAEPFAIHAKGLEGPAHDPRSGKALAVTYATANRGMCHIHPVEAMAWDAGKMDFGLQGYGLADPEGVGRWDEAGKGEMTKLLQDGLILPDILGTCKFYMYAGVTLDHWADILSALIGEDVDGEALLRVGERTINLQRLFNLREGFTTGDDTLPERVLELPAFGAFSEETACVVEDLDSMLREYYEARNWDADSGGPTVAKQEELGLVS